MDLLCRVVLRKEQPHMAYFNYISVGIDVGADFSWMSILTPDHKPVTKPFKIYHDKLDSLEKAVFEIKIA